MSTNQSSLQFIIESKYEQLYVVMYEAETYRYMGTGGFGSTPPGDAIMIPNKYKCFGIGIMEILDDNNNSKFRITNPFVVDDSSKLPGVPIKVIAIEAEISDYVSKSTYDKAVQPVNLNTDIISGTISLVLLNDVTNQIVKLNPANYDKCFRYDGTVAGNYNPLQYPMITGSHLICVPRELIKQIRVHYNTPLPYTKLTVSVILFILAFILVSIIITAFIVYGGNAFIHYYKTRYHS